MGRGGFIDPSTDWYAVLGVPETASPEEVKRAWRRRVAMHHPDRGGDRERFEAVQTAWETIGDAGSRAAYDRLRARAEREAAAERAAAAEAARARRRPPAPGGRETRPPTQPGPPGVRFVFPSGEEVLLSTRNRHGAWVPTGEQRRLYRMGPRWVYERLRPRDRVFRIRTPRQPTTDAGAAGTQMQAALWWLIAGPEWFRPRLRAVASIVLLVGSGVLSSAMGGGGSAAPIVLWLAAWWWPLPRLIAAGWWRLPGRASGALGGAVCAALGAVAAGSAAPWRIAVVAVIATALGAGVADALGRLRRWLPRRVSDWLACCGV